MYSPRLRSLDAFLLFFLTPIFQVIPEVVNKKARRQYAFSLNECEFSRQKLPYEQQRKRNDGKRDVGDQYPFFSE